MHVVPQGVTEAVRAQAERALAAFARQHVTAAQRADPARGAQRPDRDPARGGARAPRRDGRLGAARATPARRCSARCPEAIAQRAKPTVIVVKTREPIGRQTFEQLAQQAETLEAADRAAEESRAIPARVDRWFAESNFHH